jgi:folate-binding protein YgfZ
MSRAVASAAGGVGAAADYRAAHDEAVLVDPFGVAALRVTGKDALDLLHRLSTNDLKAIPEGGGAPTVFTTAKGRIVALVTVHRLAGALHLLVETERAEALRDWIDRYTFREEVQVEDRRASHTTLGVCGPRARDLVAAVFPPAAGRGLHGAAEVEVAGAPALLVRSFPLAGDAWLLNLPRAAADAARARLLAAGGAGLVPASAGTVEALRLEAGLPAAGRELTEEHNPWEARLDEAISLSKGCYLGQEVIARLNTYRKVARLLVRLESDESGAAAPGAKALPFPEGAEVTAAGQTIGAVTSSVVLPEGENRVLALAYVRDEDAVPGKGVSVATPAGPREAIVRDPRDARPGAGR